MYDAYNIEQIVCQMIMSHNERMQIEVRPIPLENPFPGIFLEERVFMTQVRDNSIAINERDERDTAYLSVFHTNPIA
jgi:hypothetical protein